MEKRLLQFLFLSFAIALVFVVWRPHWKYDINEAPQKNSEEKIIFEVERGSSTKTIAQELDDAGLVVNKKSFIRTVKDEELTQNLRYGRFVLSPSMTLREVVDILSTEGTGELAFTVIEGWTINQIDAALTEQGVIEAGEFRTCTFNCEFEFDFLDNDHSLEGFLFPDTYFIEVSTFNSKTFIEQMLRNFDNKVTDEMMSDLDKQDRSLREAVIVASMLEREVRTEKDIPIVSGIIWKRLDNDWTLGIDATLLYVQDDNELSAEDLAMESPYNTRQNKGLPPTAISSPGLPSLKGAIYPEDSTYWFYLTTLDTGEVIYGKTNEEHESNKSKYL